MHCGNIDCFFNIFFVDINQSPIPSFLIGLFKTESGVIVRSFETGLGRWTQVAAMVSIDAYPFLAFSNLTSLFENTWIVFSGCTVLPDSKVTELGSSQQEAPPSTDKNTRVGLVPCYTWKCAPAANSSGVDFSEVPGCHLLQQMSSQWGSQKLLQGLVPHELTPYLSVFGVLLTQWFMAILSKVCKPDLTLRITQLSKT